MAHPPDFYLFLTDGDPAHLPSIKEIQQDYKPTDDYGLTQKALSIFATEMMKRLDRKIKDGQTYTKIPHGYSVWPRQRGGHKDVEKPKIDWYIFGHPNHKKFDSFAQFTIHIHFLQLQQPPEDCPCKVCSTHPLAAGYVVSQDPAPASIVTPTPSEDHAPPEETEPDMDETPTDRPLRAPIAQMVAPSSTGEAQPNAPRQEPEQYAEAASSSFKPLPTGPRRTRVPDNRPAHGVTMQSGENAEHEAASDSDATVGAEDIKQEHDDSDYAEDGGREPDGGKKSSKRALSAEDGCKKPSKRVRTHAY
ncbi:MAG: hypothetical protein ALECFALPRED_009263 [Alectoria fallacina]|uniref:Cryptic loci regulator 2 N-terminal domain-containing protein n=1 Tax=Alectoria fallacina TaxID=1903189 RepID=A0A8H3J6R5_9LECA|nr:MAG: hypothetical protein ALECFALPRED_009263 [Alectoria fallacina]